MKIFSDRIIIIQIQFVILDCTYKLCNKIRNNSLYKIRCMFGCVYIEFEYFGQIIYFLIFIILIISLSYEKVRKQPYLIIIITFLITIQRKF